MPTPQLDKEVEKRFDKVHGVWMIKEHYPITYSDLKQLLATELDRIRKEFVEFIKADGIMVYDGVGNIVKFDDAKLKFEKGMFKTKQELLGNKGK